MKDPERYSRILRSTTEILEGKIATLQELKRIEDRLKAMVPYEIDPFRLYFTRSVEGLWEFGDSVLVEVDSLVPVLEMHLHETSDTLFDGPRIILKADSLAVDDTMEVVETLEVKEPKDNVVLEKRLFSKTLDSLKRK